MITKLVGAAIVGAAFVTALALNIDSGLKVGEGVTPFHPKHITGPNKGTSACPPCTYGSRPQVQVWVNGDDHSNMAKIAKTLSEAVKANKGSELKAFVIALVDKGNAAETEAYMAALVERTGIDNIALATLAKSDHAVSDYKVNTNSEVKNTIFVYKNKTVASKFVNLKADEKGIAALSVSINSVVK